MSAGETPAEENALAQTAREGKGEYLLFVGAKWALMGGVLVAGVVLLGRLLIGQVYSGAEARGLLESLAPSARSVSTAVLTASATILALMLTMLGLTRQAGSRLEAMFYRRVERIGLLSTIALVSAILLLLFLSIPIEESKNVPEGWFGYLYYGLVTLTAALAGLLVTIILMLYNAMQSLLQVLSPIGYGERGQGESGEVREPRTSGDRQ